MEIRPGLDLDFLTPKELADLKAMLIRQSKEHPNIAIASRSGKAAENVEREQASRASSR